jgi:hypothetical protein
MLVTSLFHAYLAVKRLAMIALALQIRAIIDSFLFSTIAVRHLRLL